MKEDMHALDFYLRKIFEPPINIKDEISDYIKIRLKEKLDKYCKIDFSNKIHANLNNFNQFLMTETQAN